MDFDITMKDVMLRPGVSVDVHLKVYVNEPHPCYGKIVFAVHGLAHTSATWEPFAEEVFKENPTGRKVCQIVAVDLPSRGGTTLPTGMLFGDLTLGDHVTVLQTVLKRLPAIGIRPDAILGHSQGGLLIQMTQQALRDMGTDLRQAFNVKNVVLLAPVGPRELPWYFADSGTAAAVIGGFVAFDPALGLHISIPDAVWPYVFFTNFSGMLVPGAPTPAEVAAKGYNAPEPLFASLELAGLPPFTRPSVDPGIFTLDSGAVLQVVGYQNDVFVLVPEAMMLYQYLTGDSTNAGFVAVPGDYAVHDTHVSAPRTLLDAIAGTIELP
ncbi:MAG: alpha/beta fold hydrolase [bacterium]